MEGKSMKRWSRRQFVGGAGLLVTGGCVAVDSEQHVDGRTDVRLRQKAGGKPFQALEADDRVDVGGDPQAVIEKAYSFGYDLEKEHGGCARCTVAALQRALPFVPEDPGLFRAATCLDGGATPHRVQNCGAFTGAGMVIGYVCGTEPFESPRLARKLIRKVYARFEAEYGTVLCKDVRTKADRDCPKVVGHAAQWTAEVLLAQFADYQRGQSDA
jgi:hypothetical protein